MKKRALVIGMGAWRGSYDGGVLYELSRALGENHFSHIFASSVGAYNASFFVTGQYEQIEDIWKNRVHGLLLLNPFNPLRGRKILDLEYLTRLFQSPAAALHTEKIFSSPVQVRYAATEERTMTARYLSPSRGHIFDQLKASSALPFIHGPVMLADKSKYLDAALSAPLPLGPALEGDFDEIVVVYNKPKGFYTGWELSKLMPITPYLLDDVLNSAIRTLPQMYRGIENILETHPRIKVIRPREQLPLRSILDTSRKNLVAAFEMGRREGKVFLETYRV